MLELEKPGNSPKSDMGSLESQPHAVQVYSRRAPSLVSLSGTII